MSIPWPGFSHHQLVQVTSVFATFLSPFALAVLANTTNSLVRHHCHTAEPHQQCCNLSRTYSSESRQKAASEPDLVSEQEAVLQDSCQRIRHCSGVSETVLAPIEYCTCYLSDIEEGGDFLPIRLMESSGSQKPAGDEVQAGSINNCTKPSGHGGSQQVLGKNNSQTTDSNCSAEWNNNLAKTRMVGRIGEEASFKTKQEMVKSIHLQKSSKSPCDIGEHELHAPDDSELQVKSKSEKETAYKNTNLAPTSKVNNSLPDLKKVTTDGMPDGDSTTISSQECSKNEQRCQAKVVPEQSVKEAEPCPHRKCNAIDDAAGGKNNTVPPKETIATGAKNTDKRKQTLNSKKTKGVKDSSVDVESRQNGQKREKSPETRSRSPKIAHKKTTEEKPPASRKIVSRSSSRESFSTACCSSTSSSSYQLDSEKEDGPKPQSKDHDHREDDSLAVKEICTHPASKEVSSHAQPNPSPLFALATPPFSIFPDHQNAISKQTFCIKHGAQDYDHSSSEYDTKMDTNFLGWFKSVLKAWLPFAGQKTQNSASRRRNNYFHEYDIRNILNPRLEGLWATRQAPVSSSQPYPHSCASSLCNFRLTLESWKKELQEMHDALEESSNAVPENPCTFCHKDHHCQGFTSCRTMQLAQKFWSTIVDLKRSHMQSCECPHLNQKFEKPNLDSSCDEADQSKSWNSCRNDFSGCSQSRNSFLTGDVREAPCVHVLLDELDLLQKNLKRLTRTKVNTKSQVCQTDQAFRLNEQTVGDQDEVPISAKKQLQEGDGRTSAQAYLSDAVPGRHDSVRRSHRSAVNSASGKPVQDGHGSQKKERSNTSKLSPSASLSLTEEMGELDELSDFFLGQRKRSTSHQNSGNLTECQNMIPEYLGSFTRVGSAHKSVKPSDVVIPQTTSLPQLVNSGNPQVISNTHKASRQHSDQEQDNSDTQAVNKTRNLGKCALQYLGHIENTLDNQAATSPSVSTSSTAPACDGDIPKPVRRNSLSRADSTSQSDSSKISQFSQITADSESEKPSSYGTAEGSVAELFSESSQCATVKEQGVGSLLCGQKDSTLKTAFDSIIADLIQFQQNQCRDKIEKRPDTPLDKSPKNVKFSPSSTQKTDSMTNVSSLGDISPPLHGLVPSDSSSNEDCLKDVNVTEAFDQLDKIVDELLHLMESRPEPCVK